MDLNSKIKKQIVSSYCYTTCQILYHHNFHTLDSLLTHYYVWSSANVSRDICSAYYFTLVYILPHPHQHANPVA